MSKKKRILLFLSFPFTVLLLLEIVSRQMFLSHSDMTAKFNEFDEVKSQIEVLFMGNSHVEKGINPDLIAEKSFNLAFSAQDLYYNHKILQKHISEMHNLKKLVIGIDPFAFYYDESINSMFFVKDYFYYEQIWPKNGFDLPFLFNSSVFWLNRGDFFIRLLQFNFTKSKIEVIKSEKFSEINDPGQYLLTNGMRLAIGKMNESELKNDALITINRIVNNSKTELISENYSYLSKMIKLADNNGVEVILVCCPVYENYISRIPESIKMTSDSLINNLVRQNQKVRFYDFSSVFDKKPDYFFNSDHLNKEGSAEFSRMVSEIF